MKGRGFGILLVSGSFATASGCGSSSAPAPPPDCTTAQASQIALSAGGYTSIDATTDGGCATFPSNLSAINGTQYLVIGQAATGLTDSVAPYELRNVTPTGARLAAARIATVAAAPTPVAVSFDHFLRQMGRQLTLAGGPVRAAPAGAVIAPAIKRPVPVVGTQDSFVVCTTLNCLPFKKVIAVAQAVGQHVAIFVDTMTPHVTTSALSTADLDTLRQLFDTLLFPLDTATFGAVSDIDSNHVVIALMTPLVNQIVTASQCISSGYLAGFFLPNDLVPGQPLSQSNQGEIFYSIVADSTGKLSCAHTATAVKRVTPGVFIHEFQHMINFVQHYLVRTAPSEEGWLDEGQSKYAEELLSRRRFLPGNPTAFYKDLGAGDLYDAWVYLAEPDSSNLLIALDQGTLPEIGASWLFDRFIMDQYGGAVNSFGGAALAGKLDQTTFTGASNVQTQTGQTFTTLLERWALANWVSDLPGFTPDTLLKYKSWTFRSAFDSLHVQYPGVYTTGFPLVPPTFVGGMGMVSGKLGTGSGSYVLATQAPSGARFTLQFSGTNALLPSYFGPRFVVIRIQ